MQGDSRSKFEHLKKNLKEIGSVAIAFSGGVDSTFLLKVAFDVLKENAIAVTIVSSIFSKRELDETKLFAKKIGVKHVLVNFEVTDIINFSKNNTNRCYYCKKELFSKVKEVANQNEINFVLDGSNADDINDYRPGMQALKELGVISPLIDVSLTKKEIRKLSKDISLDTWDKSSFACLASRFPYGTKITKSKLKQVEKAEEIIKSFGVKQFRVRYHDKIARIEVLKNDFEKILEHSDEITREFKKLGFNYVTLDIEGYRKGSLNEVIV